MEIQNVYGIRIQVFAITAMVASITLTTAAIPGHVLLLLTRAIATMPSACTALAMSTRPGTIFGATAIQCVVSKNKMH